MNIGEAKKYFQENPGAELLVVPRRHQYIMQLRDNKKLINLTKTLTNSVITCDTLEEINTYAKKLNKFDYHLIQNDPHVEMAGFDQDGDANSPREDVTVVSFKKRKQ